MPGAGNWNRTPWKHGKPDGVDDPAGFGRAGGRIYDAIQDMVADGTVTELANKWFFMPQQRYVRQRLMERQRWYLGLLYAAALAFCLSARFWLRARACAECRRRPGAGWGSRAAV